MGDLEERRSNGQRTTSNDRAQLVPRHDALRAWWARHRLAHGRRPLLGAAIVGGAALGLAVSFGALELALGSLAAYTAYRMLRYGIDLRQALTETIEVEQLCRREL
jgi:hypothetical protein